MITLHPLDAERVDAVISAYEEVGIRAVVGLQIADVPPLATTPYWLETIPPHMLDLVKGHQIDAPSLRDPTEVIEEYASHSPCSELLRWAISPSSPERCSPPLLKRLFHLAERYGLPVYSHIYISKAEALNARRQFGAYGGSLIRYLDSLGFLNERLSVAHGVWLEDEEVRRLGQVGASVVLNTISNLKNKNGVAPIRGLIAAGVNIALGCDNCSCTDVQNIFQAMKMTCLLAAVSDPRPGPPSAMDALRAATTGGARTAGLQDELGVIAPGMRADLVLFDLADTAFVPLNNAARQLVYSECGRAVETVIVNGRLVMENRRIKTIDEAALRTAVDDAMARFRPEAERVVRATETLSPYLLRADEKTWAQDIGMNRYIGGS
jgi:guanine deaminase